MAVEVERPNHINRALVRRYLERLASAKKIYEARIPEDIRILGSSPNEGWDFFGSPLVDQPEKGRPIGYFSPNGQESFAGIGGFSAEKFKEEIDRFRNDPANQDRKVMILDTFGQGTPFVEIADEIVATTLTKNPRTPPGVTEFNGDALSSAVSEQMFAHLRSRIREGFALRASFFRPVGGLQSVARNLYVIHTLYERLQTIYKLTDEGGLIFIQTAGSGGYDISFLKEILASEGFESIASTDAFPENLRMLLRKDSAVCKSLPTVMEIAAKHPDIMKRLLNIDTSTRTLARKRSG